MELELKKKVSIKQVALKGKRVFLRLDLNVPLSEGGIITDETRILAALPTVKYIMDEGGRTIISSHLGRPKGKVQAEFSLKPVADALRRRLGREVPLAPDCVGEKVRQMVDSMKDGDVLLLENLRFHKGEEENDPELAQALAALGDVYVDDAFGAAHRAHASVSGITRFLKPRAAGFLLEREMEHLTRLTARPDRPFIGLLGGAKVSDKLGVIENLMGKFDSLLIGGGMAFTFLKAKGLGVGRSLVEDDKLEAASTIMSKMEESGFKLALTEDHVIARSLKDTGQTTVVDASRMPEDCLALDIGPRTVRRFSDEIRRAKTVFWNGPMGVFEIEAFRAGTKAVGQAVADSGAVSVVCGGDTGAAVAQLGIADKMTHISTGGGAALEFLEGRELPGIASLDDA